MKLKVSIKTNRSINQLIPNEWFMIWSDHSWFTSSCLPSSPSLLPLRSLPHTSRTTLSIWPDSHSKNSTCGSSNRRKWRANKEAKTSSIPVHQSDSKICKNRYMSWYSISFIRRLVAYPCCLDIYNDGGYRSGHPGNGISLDSTSLSLALTTSFR